MLVATHSVYGCSIEGTDALAGNVRDLLFNDQTWDIKHLVVHTGNWLTGHSELLSPKVVETADWHGRHLRVHLTKEEVERQPPLGDVPMIARRDEAEARKLIAWETYWTGILAGFDARETDPHIDSAKEVNGYRIEAFDGIIGHVEDFIVDDDTWKIRYLVVDTRNWFPGRHVLLMPMSVRTISWDLRKIHVELSRETIRSSPDYDRTVPVDRPYEERLHDHYDVPKYWLGVGAGVE